MHGECSVVNKNQTLNVNNGSYHRDVHGFKSFKKDWAVPRQEVYQVERQIFKKKKDAYPGWYNMDGLHMKNI